MKIYIKCTCSSQWTVISYWFDGSEKIQSLSYLNSIEIYKFTDTTHTQTKKFIDDSKKTLNYSSEEHIHNKLMNNNDHSNFMQDPNCTRNTSNNDPHITDKPKTNCKMKFLDSFKRISSKHSNSTISSGSIPNLDEETQSSKAKIGKWISRNLKLKGRKHEVHETKELFTSRLANTQEKEDELVNSDRSQKDNSDNSYSLLVPPDLPSVSTTLSEHKALNNISESLQTNETKDDKKKSKIPKRTTLIRTDHRNLEPGHVPTTYMSTSETTLRVSLQDGLREIRGVLEKLHDDEYNIKQLLCKYIKDTGFEKELLDAICCYGRVHIDSERRAQTLANEMWLQRNETYRTQEKMLQDHLNVIVKQNRQQQNEIEKLRSINEDLIMDKIYPRSISDSFDLVKSHNDELRKKTHTMQNQLKALERELHNLQDQKQCLANQLNNADVQLQHYKGLLQRASAEHEIQQSSLSQQLTMNEQIIKDSIEASDTLVEDLESVNRQLKTLSITINWSKFKFRGESLVDLVHMCRSCINELSKELINRQTIITLQNKDIDHLKDETDKLNMNLQLSNNELAELRHKLEACSGSENNLNVCVHKNDELQLEISMCLQELKETKERLAREQDLVKTSTENLSNITKQLADKDNALTKTNEQLNEITAENFSLKKQLETNQKYFEDAGITALKTETAEANEKLLYFQSQYYQLVAELNALKEQNKRMDLEREAVKNFQDSFYEYLKLQQKDIEKLNSQNYELKEQLMTERNIIFDKNEKIAKQNGENNVMKTIYQQLNTEFAKNMSLEANSINMNFEINRYAVAAEYNKHINEQLQSIIAEKDQQMEMLQVALGRLKEKQMSCHNEKVSLRHDLNLSETINKQLQHEIVEARQKMHELEMEKKNVEINYEAKVQELQQLLRDEKSALHELVNDYRNVLTQKSQFSSLQDEHLKQIEYFKINEVKLQANLDQTKDKLNIMERQCIALENKLEESQKFIDDMKSQTNLDIAELQKKIDDCAKVNSTLKEDNEKLRTSTDYLQCTSQKLQSDLDELRAVLKEKDDIIIIYTQQISELEQELRHQNTVASDLRNVNENLMDEINEHIRKYEFFLNEHDAFVETTDSSHQTLMLQISELERKDKHQQNQIEELLRGVEDKNRVLEEMDQVSRKFEDLKEIHERVLADLDDKTTQLNQALDKQNLTELQLKNLANEQKESIENDKKYCDKIKMLNDEIIAVREKREIDYNVCKKFIETFKTDNEQSNLKMREDLKMLTNCLSKFKEEYKLKCGQLDETKKKYADLSKDYMIAIDTLNEERTVRNKLDTSLSHLSIQEKALKEELECTRKNVEVIRAELSESTTKIKALYKEKQELLEMVEQLKVSLNSVNNSIDSEMLDEAIGINGSASDDKLHKAPANCAIERLQRSLNYSKEKLSAYKRQLQDNHATTLNLTNEVFKLKHDVQVLEFEKCEKAMKIHEMEKNLQIQQTLNEELRDLNQRLLASIWATQMSAAKYIDAPAPSV